MMGSDAHLEPFGQAYCHPRNYGTFPRALAKYVREMKVLTLEEGIRKMTLMSASKYGVRDRGVIRPEAFGDMVVFDSDTIEDNATFDNPRQYPSGISYVLVNGKIAVEKEKTASERIGRVLRRG